MTDADLARIEGRRRAARDMVHALCLPKGSRGSREWIMSIPARPDYDPDLVIAASLAALPAVVKELREARKLLDECGDFMAMVATERPEYAPKADALLPLVNKACGREAGCCNERLEFPSGQ